MPINTTCQETGFEVRESTAVKMWLQTKHILHILASEVKLLKYVETVQHNTENQKSALTHFCPWIEVEHSSAQTMMCFMFA
jgi:hypothetical protein